MIKRVLLRFSSTALALLALSHLSSAYPILLNSGFETAGANPGGASNWYGYTYAEDASSNISSSVSSSPAAVASGNYGFLLKPDSVSGAYSSAWVETDRFPLPGGPMTLSFQFKTIVATAPNTWSNYKISFFDSSNNEIAGSAMDGEVGYSWGAWGTKTVQNITPPFGAVTFSVTLAANASGAPGGDAQWAFDNVHMRSVATKTVLLDIGRSDADGGTYGGRTPASPDTNTNHWNTLDLGKYAGSMKDKTNGTTTFGAGFINTNNPSFGWYNGPAGDDTLPWSIDKIALGDLGIEDAAFDFVSGNNVRMSIDGLVPGKKYRLKFFCSRRWVGDVSTKISVYNALTFDASALLDEGTVANRRGNSGDDPAQAAWIHNSSTLLILDNLPAAKTSLFINIAGASGGNGVLNSMSIEELDIPTLTPVITSTGNGSGTVGQSFTYNITADYATSYNATGLPAGLSVSPTTGVISGTPTAAGDAVVALIASNADKSATNSITISIAKGISSVTVTSPNSATPTGSSGNISYSYVGTGTTSYGPTATEPTLPGDYEVTATLAADANYESAFSAPYPFSIAQSDPLATWLAGSPTNSQTVGKYAIGGAASVSGASEAPVMTASNNVLSLTAIVRKASANPKLNVDAEWANSLSGASWTNQSVTSTTSGLAQPSDPELERRKFSVPYDPSSESRKFLRLKATLSP
jgi:hypothetical protein